MNVAIVGREQLKTVRSVERANVFGIILKRISNVK